MGEEAFEEHFDQLATMYIYSFHAMLLSFEDPCIHSDQLLNWDNFDKVLPFVMDIAGHLLLHHDDTDDDISSTYWLSDQMKDYFSFDSGVDWSEIM